jgi:hypothetical protein
LKKSLELETQVPCHGLREWSAELFCFCGRDQAAALRVAGDLAAMLSGEAATRQAPLRLRALAEHVAAQRGLGTEPVQFAITARSVDELGTLLRRGARGGT